MPRVVVVRNSEVPPVMVPIGMETGENLPLAKLDDETLENVVRRLLTEELAAHGLRREPYHTLPHVPLGVRVFAATNWVEAEVSNGGFSQFFWNRSADSTIIASDAGHAYSLIGAPTHADAVSEALALAQESHSRLVALQEPSVHRSDSEAFAEWCDFWDQRCSVDESLFYDTDNTLPGLRAAWARANAEQFCFER